MRLILAIALAAPLSLAQEASKLDDGLDAPEQRYPVFVRMADQVFRRGGDFEAFCKKNAKAKRSRLREQVMTLLREKADTAWKKIEKPVRRLEDDGQVAQVTRRWIVSGFFCQATGKACATLAALDEVGFVYRQRVVAQHRPPAAPGSTERHRASLAAVLEKWQDDSDEPFSPKGLTVPWNLKRVRAPEAWKRTTGKGAVVALFDSGLLVTPALTQALLRNPAEELNGKDDDGNGYVDDLFGWDFGADHNYPLGDRNGHGSMCAGIVAGRPAGGKKIITGVAPRARVLPLRGMGWLEAYQYALARGADVVSMSYMWVRRPLGHYRGLYRLAHEHLTAAGVVGVGGAGNFARLPKWKQIALPKDIPCVIAASGILRNGDKAPQSSEGPCTWAGVHFYDDYPKSDPLMKPDVTGCFGGYPVWCPTQRRRRQWRVVFDAGGGAGLVIGPQGNSFAGPHAAGVAALMLSANPELPAWRVKELMEKTCQDLGPKGRDSVFGAGLLQADKAVKAAIDAR